MDWQDATCYLNGEWLPLKDARIPVLDRGFIFGDGVYEVIPVDEVAPGRSGPFRAREHFERLARSLSAVRIANPFDLDGWQRLLAESIARNAAWPRQSFYLQVTRGVARRDHPFPAGVTPTVFAMSTPWAPIPREQIEQGIAVVTHADERWLHCDIKSVSLLGNVLMKQYAVEHNASETVMLRDGWLTEGSSTNVLVVRGGTLIAPQKSNRILPGITYDAAFDIARARGVPVQARPIPEAELRAADEVWISSSGRDVLPAVRIDGAPVGDGRPGPLYRQMIEWFGQAKREDGKRWLAQYGAVA
ncbi:MAG: D-amino acid aminotransferase [Betaproteobacteria bacterium]|jgi:D-alanine transaminase